jgi:hypothetical protein
MQVCDGPAEKATPLQRICPHWTLRNSGLTLNWTCVNHQTRSQITASRGREAAVSVQAAMAARPPGLLRWLLTYTPMFRRRTESKQFASISAVVRLLCMAELSSMRVEELHAYAQHWQANFAFVILTALVVPLLT